MKIIWIIDHYSSEPKYGGIQRQFDFANELSKRGYKTVIVSSSFSHYTHSYISEENCYITKFAEHSFYAYLKTSPYAANGGFGRIRNMISFVAAVKKNCQGIVDKLGKPDVVVGASIHPLAWIAAYSVAKKYKVKFIAEVRDLWPEAFLLSGEKMWCDPMVIFFRCVERWMFKKADKIIYSMLYGDKYFCDKCGLPRNKVFLIEQPMDCERFDRNSSGKINEVPKAIMDFIYNSFVCVFTGYFMYYEGVMQMLEAAKIVKSKGLPIKFLFIGSGEEEENMKNYVNNNNLENVLIYGRISKEIIPAVLTQCDICLAHCAFSGKENAFKYGISKNKVNEYLYSGNCVIYGRDDKNDPVAKYSSGYVINPFDSKQFYEKIVEVYFMSPEKRSEFGKNGRNYINKYHRTESLVDKLLEIYDIDKI